MYAELSGQDVAAIEELHNRWITEELAGHSSQLIELCTDDVTWIPPNALPLVGKEAIARYLNDSCVELKDVERQRGYDPRKRLSCLPYRRLLLSLCR